MFAAHRLVEVTTETDAEFERRVGRSRSERFRCVGEVTDAALAAAAETGSWLECAGVVMSGRHEMLHYLREQAISWSMHRFGHVADGAEDDVNRALAGN